MKNLIALFVFLCILLPNAFAQSIKSGINVQVPNSTLTVGGSFGAGYRETSLSTTLTDQDYYVTYNGTTSGQTITLPQISTVTNLKFSGRGYKIKNVSDQGIILQCSPGNTIRYSNNKVLNSIPLLKGVYAELVCTQNDTNWDLLFISEIDYNATITKSDFLLPTYLFLPGTEKEYNTGNNWIVKSVVAQGNYDWRTRSVKVTYEYQGLPFDITDMAVVATVDAPVALSLGCSLKLSAENKVILEVGAAQVSAGDYKISIKMPLRILFINAN